MVKSVKYFAFVLLCGLPWLVFVAGNALIWSCARRWFEGAITSETLP